MANSKDNKKIIAEADRIFKEYKRKMKNLRDEQDMLINEYIEKLKERKIEKLRKNIKN